MSEFITLHFGDGLPMMVNINHITHVTPSGTGTHLHILGTTEVYKVLEDIEYITDYVNRVRQYQVLSKRGLI